MKRIAMRNTAVALILLTVLTSRQSSSAQSDLKSSGSLIFDGVKAYDSGSYKRAAAIFMDIPEGDTNYATAQYELALTYQADSAHTESRDILLRALQHPQVEKRRTMLLLANAYDYLGENEKALQEYGKLIALNPNDHQPYYEAGVVYFRKQQLDSAQHYFRKSLLIFPRHHRSMQLLGSTYALQGRLTEAWICLQTCLLSTSNIEIARAPIRFMDGISKQTDDFSEPYKTKRDNYTHPLFDEIDAIINSKIILSSDYKIKSALSDEPLAKMTYAIMEKLKYDKDDDNFVMQYFVPLWIELRDKSLADPFLINAFSGYNFEKIEKLAVKEKKDIAKANEVIFPYFNLVLATRVLNYEERKKASLKYKMLENEGIYYTANQKSLSEFDEGPISVYKNGSMIASGNFNKTAEKDGKWNYYYLSGEQKSTEMLHNGKSSGNDTAWRQNGQLKSADKYNADGKFVYGMEYDEHGNPSEDYELVNDDIVRNNTYYENGSKKLSILLSKKVYQNGDYDGWHENGKLMRHFSIKDAKLEGLYTEFYEDGTPMGVYNYKDGKLQGAYIAYHDNGKPATKATYNNGEEEGLYEKWDENGRQTVRQEYEKGKLTGKKSYFDEGVEFGYVEYKNDKPVAYEFKDQEGKVVASEKGTLKSVKTYYSNGNISAEFPLEDGVVSGMVRYYTYGGSLREESAFKNGKQEGKETTYFKNGKKDHEMTNKEDVGNGLYEGYHKNGNLIAKGMLAGGEKQGVWTFYNTNGKLNSKCFYDNGSLNGPMEEFNISGELTGKDYYFEKGMYRMEQFDSAGNIIHQATFPKGCGTYTLLCQENKKPWFEAKLVNGRFEGAYTKYYPDGSKMESGSFKHGEKDGPVETFAFNGVKTTTGFLKDGKRTGLWEFYDETGAHKITMSYKEGEVSGKKYSYVNDQINYESNYENGRKQGPQYVYDKNKQLALVVNYSDGIVMSYSYEGKDGKLVPEIKLKNGSGKVIAYYANGKKSAELNFDQSNVHGKQFYYFSNGNLAEERNAVNDDYDGEWKEYYENGKIKISCSYKDDELNGAYTLYDENGKIVVLKNYVCDQEHGVTELKDPKTQQIRKMQFRYGYALKSL